MRISPVLAILLIFFSTQSRALEVDEKLTLRILKSSGSKKTILVNRGIDDGLAKGDHAKFFLTTGVISRGVIVKVSPTRSVWSLYRLVNPEFIQTDQVMNLKITPPIKVMENEKDKDSVTFYRQKVKKLDENNQVLSSEDTLDLKEMKELELKKLIHLKVRNWELVGSLALTSFGAVSSSSANSLDSSGKNSYWDIGAGIEYYFLSEDSWYFRLSPILLFDYQTQTILGSGGEESAASNSMFGIGFNYHLFRDPHVARRVVPYANVSFYKGSVSEVNKSATETSSEAGVGEEVKGSSSVTSFGVGAKYYLEDGYGIRAMLEYVMRKEAYDADSSGFNRVKEISGPKFMFALSYRF